MARLIDRTFNPNEPVVVRRHFVAAGRHFRIGDDFDWKRLAVDQRRVKQLYDVGRLMHRTLATAQRPAPEAKVQPVTPAPTIEQELQGEDIHNAAVEAASANASDAAIDAALSAPVDDEPQDDLTDMSMKELRAIAYKEGASSRVSRKDQREAIRANRRTQENQ